MSPFCVFGKYWPLGLNNLTRFYVNTIGEEN